MRLPAKLCRSVLQQQTAAEPSHAADVATRGPKSMPGSAHRRVVGQPGFGSPATQLMRAVSWHDNAGVSSPVGNERISGRRAKSGRRSVGFDAELGSTKRGWLTKSRAVRIPTSHSRLLAGEAGWLSCVSAGGALAELVIAGPHEVQRRGVVGARAGGLLEDHAAAGGWRWSAVVGQKRGARSCIAVQRGPTELCSRPRFAARQTSALAKGALGRCVVSTRRSGLASESSWAPPLRPRPGRRPCVSWWHTCRRCGGPLAACRQLTMACS